MDTYATTQRRIGHALRALAGKTTGARARAGMLAARLGEEPASSTWSGRAPT